VAYVYHPELDRTVEVTDDQAVVMRAGGWEPVDDVRGTFVNPLQEALPPMPLLPEERSDIDPDTGALVEPPRGGPGSGREAWAEYATALGLTVSEDATRDDLIELVDAIDAVASTEHVDAVDDGDLDADR
jgi:hypothetical protein